MSEWRRTFDESMKKLLCSKQVTYRSYVGSKIYAIKEGLGHFIPSLIN